MVADAQAGSSGDLLADRRFAWAMGAAAQGDHAAAADLLAQTLDLAPGWLPALVALGDARLACGDRAGAARAYAQAAEIDRDGLHGAALKGAALGAEAPPPTAPAAYVARLFDDYAAKFDAHLVGALGYVGPRLLREALERVCAARGRAFAFDRAIDLGCGTGLMGAAIADAVDSLEGVDLSPAMVAAAREGGLYAHLHVGEVVAFLREQADAGADLILAADVFVYMGDLAETFREAARALAPGGLFAFTVQRGEGADYALGEDVRYAHSAAYLRALAQARGLEVAHLEDASTRRDRGRDVPGLLAVLARP